MCVGGVHVWTHWYTHECGGQRSYSVVISQSYFLPCVLKQGLSPTWSSPRLGLLVSTPQRFSCLYCPSAGFTSVHLIPDFVSFDGFDVSAKVPVLSWHALLPMESSLRSAYIFTRRCGRKHHLLYHWSSRTDEHVPGSKNFTPKNWLDSLAFIFYWCSRK